MKIAKDRWEYDLIVAEIVQPFDIINPIKPLSFPRLRGNLSSQRAEEDCIAVLALQSKHF